MSKGHEQEQVNISEISQRQRDVIDISKYLDTAPQSQVKPVMATLREVMKGDGISYAEKLRLMVRELSGVLKRTDAKKREALLKIENDILHELGTIAFDIDLEDDQDKQLVLLQQYAEYVYVMEEVIVPALKQETAVDNALLAQKKTGETDLLTTVAENPPEATDDPAIWNAAITQVTERITKFHETLQKVLNAPDRRVALEEHSDALIELQYEAQNAISFILLSNVIQSTPDRDKQINNLNKAFEGLKQSFEKLRSERVTAEQAVTGRDKSSVEDWEKNPELHPDAAKNVRRAIVAAQPNLESLVTKKPQAKWSPKQFDERIDLIDQVEAQLQRPAQRLLVTIEAYQTAPEPHPDKKASNTEKANFLQWHYYDNPASGEKGKPKFEEMGVGVILKFLSEMRQYTWEMKAEKRFPELMKDISRFVDREKEPKPPKNVAEVGGYYLQLQKDITDLRQLLDAAITVVQEDDKIQPEEKEFLLKNLFEKYDQELNRRIEKIYAFWTGKTGEEFNIEILYPELTELRKNAKKWKSEHGHESKNAKLLADLIPRARHAVLANPTYTYPGDDGRYGAFLDERYFGPATEAYKHIHENIHHPHGYEKLIIDFFEQQSGKHHHPELINEGWRDAAPEVLADALWQYIRVFLFDIVASRAQNNFFPVKIHHFEVPLHDHDHSHMSQVIGSLGALGSYFKLHGEAEKGQKLIEAEGRMFLDCSQIEFVMNFGHDLFSKSKDMEGIKKLLGSNAYDKDDLERMFIIGRDFETGVYTGTRIGRAWQAVYAMNEPVIHEIALRSGELKNVGDPTTHLRFVRNVKEKNALAFFPWEDVNKNPEKTQLAYVKSVLIQIIAGSEEEPPWMISKNYEERMKFSQNYLQWRLFGDYDSSKPLNEQGKDIRGIMDGSVPRGGDQKKPHERSLWARFLAAGGKVGTKTTDRNISLGDGAPSEFLTAEEDTLRDKGFLAQKVATNFYYISMDHARASGGGMVKGEKADEYVRAISAARGINGRNYEARKDSKGYLEVKVGNNWYKVHDTSMGTLGENMGDRPANAGTYRSKLKSGTGADGAIGPFISIDYFYETLPSATATYASMTAEKSYFGKTLAQELFLANDGQFDKIPFQNYIAGEDRAVRYKDTGSLGVEMYEKIVGGLGINWASIATAMKGAATSPIFNFRELEKVQKLSRNVYYLLTRDYGGELHKWPTKEQYWRYRIIEQYWQNNDRDFAKIPVGAKVTSAPGGLPARYNGLVVEVTDEDRKTILKANRRYDKTYELFDARPTKDESEMSPDEVNDFDDSDGGYSRYISNVHNAYRIAKFLPDEAPKNEFERTVIRNETDGYMMRKKLILGLLLINDISVSSLTGISWDDIVVIVEFLSNEYWQARNANEFNTFIGDLFGRPKRIYNGLGLFSREEAFALLRSAGVDTSVLSRITAMSERLSRVPGVK
ncbi:MAG TPA: hypothetical protein VD999_02350 [Vitreimonas sp.]|nr:hypothetical protein [Vitreimonas sp.]